MTRPLLLAGIFCLTVFANSHAEEPPLLFPSPSAGQVVEQGVDQAAVETQAAESPVSELAVEVAPPAKTASMDRREAAKAHLAFLKERSIPLIESKSGFFSFGNKDAKITEKILRELEQFLLLYRDLPTVGEALYLKAALMEDQKEYEGAALTLIKLLHEYPDSAFIEPARKDLEGYAKKELKKEKELLLGVTVPQGGIEERYLGFLDLLEQFDREEYRPRVQGEYEEFQVRYPLHGATDRFLMRSARLYRKDDSYRPAVYAYAKLITLYPRSGYRAEAYFRSGAILTEHLDQHQEALQALAHVFTDYPKSERVYDAYSLSARTSEEELKDYSGAIWLLEEVVKLFPADEKGLKALKEIARIYDERMKQYIPAIDALQRIADSFKGDEAVAALQKAMKLAGRSLKDPRAKIELAKRIVGEYPERDAAAEAQYEIAEAYEKELKNAQDAIVEYRKVADGYPEHKLAASAMKRIEALLK